MRIIFVRHGETDWNLEGRVQGNANVPLNRKGLEQAKRVAVRLKNEKIDAIYSSDLERARQTANEIAKYHKAKVRCSKFLRERKFGELEGMLNSGYKKIRDESGLPKYLYRPPGGENYPDLQKRAEKFLAAIKKRPGQNILVVSHGGVIRTFISVLTKKHISLAPEIEQRNTAVNVIEIRRGSPPKVHCMNSTEHL